MIIDQCPHCRTRHVQTKQEFSSGLTASNEIFWYLLRCQNPNCSRLILEVKSNRGESLQIFPVGDFQLDINAPIPEPIRDDFKEAGLCLAASCFKASLVMSRRALQRCLKEQGCDQRNLVDAIDAAIKNGVLRKSFHALAEEIRHYGNLGAHPDDDQLMNANRETASQVLEFARLLIHEFYEVPAVAAKLKANRIKT